MERERGQSCQGRVTAKETFPQATQCNVRLPTNGSCFGRTTE
jgi:hypothetical protein